MGIAKVMTLLRAAAIALAVVALASVIDERPAAAHAALDLSDPAANSVLAAPPTEITLWFTEPLERSYSKAELFDQTGQPVPGAQSVPGPDDKSMVITLAGPLSNGTYSVVWQTLSNADGHTAQAYFAFTVGTQADVATVIPPADTGPGEVPLWLRTVSRWAVLLGLAAAIAVWPIWVVVLRPAISPAWQAGPGLARRLQTFALCAIAFAMLANVFALLVQAATLPSGSFSTRVWDTLTDTRYGRLWGLRIALLAILAQALDVASWWRPRSHRWRTTLALLATAALPIPVSLNAHASALTDGRTVAVAFDVAHTLGASVWVGGLLILLVGLLPTMGRLTPAGRRVVLARALPRFSLLALIAWITLGVTGLYSAWLQVGNLDGLRDTPYGRSLSIKLVLLVPLLLLGAFNLLVLTSRVRRDEGGGSSMTWVRRFGIAVSAEVVLVVLVLLVVGRLTSQQPARDVLAEASGKATLELQLNNRTGTLTLAPAATGPNHYVLVVDGELLPSGTEAVLRLTLSGQDIGQKEVKLDRAQGNRFEAHGSELSIAGDWTIQAIVRQIGVFQYAGSEQLSIAATPPTPNLPRAAWRFATGAVFGLILLLGGLSGIVFAWYVGRSPLRKESVVLGLVAIALGLLLFLQGRIEPAASMDISISNPIPADNGSIERGEAAFLANCLACHGTGGKGDGPAAAGLQPPPADFTIPHSRTHPDGQFFTWIKYGIPPSAMPAFEDELSDEEIWDVINYIRTTFQGMPTDQAPSTAATPTAVAPDTER